MRKSKFFFTIAATALLLSNGAFLNAQVTIGSDAKPAATLDVVASAPANASVPEGIIVPRMTKAQINAKQAAYTAAQTGAEVYITDYSAPSISGYSDQIGCVGFAYWDGTQWVTNCGAVSTYVSIVAQPKQFTFYETGTETETPLTVSASGSSALTYQWFKITGSNINARVYTPCTDGTDGTGANTPSFTPKVAGGLNAITTLIASKNGFYRYFVRITNFTGETVDSEIAEVAVGCGAKNLQGEWVSFMCNNLGATNNTMAVQKATSITLIQNISEANGFLRSVNERNLYGDLYQWGRMADGHENRNAIPLNGTGGTDADNSVVWNTTTPPTYENGAILGTGTQTYPWQQVARTATDYYGKFIKAIAANNYNWYAGASITQSNADMLWRENAFGSNDPCQKVTTTGVVPVGNVAAWYPPASSSTAGGSSGTGWRLPSQSEWASIFRGGSTAGSPDVAMADTWVWYQLSASDTEGAKGYEVKPDGVTTTLFLPASGNRSSNALLYYSGLNGNYWSGSTSGTNAFYLTFNSISVTPARASTRGNGFAVRCIKN